MSINTRILNTIIVTVASAVLVSCGNDDGKSSKVKLSISPSKPIVITADIKEDDQIVTGPWFRFTASLSNSSSETVTIVALEAEVTGMNASGTTTTTTKAFAPSSFNRTLNVVIPPATEPSDVKCEYTHFAQITAGGSSTLQLLGSADPTRCEGVGAIFTIGSNPKGPPGNTNFRYTVKLKPLGWFGAYAAPTDRFQKVQTFYTQ